VSPLYEPRTGATSRTLAGTRARSSLTRKPPSARDSATSFAAIVPVKKSSGPASARRRKVSARPGILTHVPTGAGSGYPDSPVGPVR